MELVYEAEIPLVPPTTNTLYINRGRSRIKNPKHRDTMEALFDLIPEKALPPAWYLLSIEVYMKVYSKKCTKPTPGNVKKMDASNRIKALEDEISDKIHLDDRYFKKIDIEKFHSEEDRTIIRIYKIEELPTKEEK
jgi:Holliday junction resolvase RusA-like endonuclease